MTVRVRFAPSPTGSLHMGSARTALFNWLFAKHHGGLFLLRIEDTDRARSTEASTQGILEALEWLGIHADEPPVVQSERFDAHVAAARDLEERGLAYRDYTDRETLEKVRAQDRERGTNSRHGRTWIDQTPPSPDASYVLRFKMPTEGETAVDDLIRGTVRVNNQEIDDLVLLRSDGTPTYNFVVVIDDAFMQISHVIRGDDHLTNTFRQVNIYRALNLPIPKFAHLPLVKGLSKRLGSASVQDYRDRGFLPDAVINYVARLGWAYQDEELFSVEDLVSKFDLDGVSKSPGAFDEQKFHWVNEQHLRKLVPAAVAQLLVPFLHGKGCSAATADGRLEQLVSLLLERAKTLEDMAERALFAYIAPAEYNAKAVKKWIKSEDSLDMLAVLADGLEALDPFDLETIETLVRSEADKRELKLGKVAQPIRICLTGSSASPPLFDTVHVVGQAEAVRRLRTGAAALRERVTGQPDAA